VAIISNIVFTRNRPLQLEGYLRSLYTYFPRESLQSYILYKPEMFQAEYEDVFNSYPDCGVIREGDFHSDLMGLLGRIETKYLLFGVDDVVYFESVNLDLIDEVFKRYPADVFGFSLRLGREMVERGGDHIEEIAVNGEQVYRLHRPGGKTPNTRYPFELCATVYPVALVRRLFDSVVSNNGQVRRLFQPSSGLMKVLGHMIKTRRILKSFGFFYSPNTLESWNCRWCRHHSEQFPQYLYFQKHCASAVQVNMVNTSNRNECLTCIQYTVELLAEKYRKGYRFDTVSLADESPKDTHCGPEFFRLCKT